MEIAGNLLQLDPNETAVVMTSQDNSLHVKMVGVGAAPDSEAIAHMLNRAAWSLEHPEQPAPRYLMTYSFTVGEAAGEAALGAVSGDLEIFTPHITAHLLEAAAVSVREKHGLPADCGHSEHPDIRGAYL